MRSAQYQSLTSLATAEIASISVTVLIAWVAIEVIVTVPITKDTMNFVVRQCKKWVNPGPAYGEKGKSRTVLPYEDLLEELGNGSSRNRLHLISRKECKAGVLTGEMEAMGITVLGSPKGIASIRI